MGCFAGKEVDPSRTGYDIRCVRPFTINSECTVEVRKDSKLYRDQNLDQTSGGLRIINDQVSLESIQSNPRNLIDQFNAETTKVTQNFYLTSFFGLKMRFIKVNRINLLINASIDLPMITFYQDEKIETLRVPITVKEPQTLERYLDDVVDKIHENYLKNGNTLLYCHDGATNSVALAIGYLLKHTDLQLSEAILHLKYIRKGFENSKCNLYGYKKYIYRFASKFDKNDIDPDTPCKSEVNKNQTKEKVASTKKKSKSGTKKRKSGRRKSKSASKKKKAKKNKSKSSSTKSHKSKSGSTKSKKSGTNSSKKQKAMLRRLTAS